MQPVHRQHDSAIRCAWGRTGLDALAAGSDAIVIVDVLSFSTSVALAVARSAIVFPCDPAEDAAALATRHRAWRAGDNPGGYHLAPHSLESVEVGCRLLLPSPNGSALSRRTGDTPTLVGCLRNARAVAEAAAALGPRISVIAAGERWSDGTIRFALEDWWGAGAICSHLPGQPSAEAIAAIEAFEAVRGALRPRLGACVSGREKHSRGQARDVELAAMLDVSDCVPRLSGGAYRASEGIPGHRPAQASDLPGLIALHEAAFRALVEPAFTWDPALQAQRMEQAVASGRTTLVSVAGEEIGAVSVGTLEGERFLERIMIHPDHQGQGIGTHLIEALLARGPLRCRVWRKNRALELYQRLGFEVLDDVSDPLRIALRHPGWRR